MINVYSNDRFTREDFENLRKKILYFLKTKQLFNEINKIQLQECFSIIHSALQSRDNLQLELWVSQLNVGQKHSVMTVTLTDGPEPSKVNQQVDLARALENTEVMQLHELVTEPSREQLMRKIQSDKEELANINKQISRLNHDLEHAMYDALISVAALRDNETGDHLLRTSKMGRILAEAVWKEYPNIPPYCTNLEIEAAIPLHDIGKVGIPDSILLKPGKLTDEEFESMKSHCNLGANLIHSFRVNNNLEHDKTLILAQQIAQSHHENFDGSGYPNQLVGEAIPFAARIMAVVDVYDALLSKRPYKKAMKKKQAIQEMVRVSEKKFDPRIFKTFLNLKEVN